MDISSQVILTAIGTAFAALGSFVLFLVKQLLEIIKANTKIITEMKNAIESDIEATNYLKTAIDKLTDFIMTKKS